MRELDPKVAERFYNSIEKTTFCWNWIGTVLEGVPSIFFHDWKCSARKVSLLLSGRDLEKGKLVLPLVCKNNLCVNPDHLVCGDEARFWSHVYKFSEANGGCWVWTASLDRYRYGQFTTCKNGIRTLHKAHVYSWELFSGLSVSQCMVVCHKCDHPWCINPDHLFLGTQKDNMRDKVEKGHQPKGETHPNAILTEEMVKSIRADYATGEFTQDFLGKRYGVNDNTIWNIVNGKTWKHLL